MTSSWRQIFVTYSIDMDKIPVVASFILNALCSLVFEYFISLFFSISLMQTSNTRELYRRLSSPFHSLPVLSYCFFHSGIHFFLSCIQLYSIFLSFIHRLSFYIRILSFFLSLSETKYSIWYVFSVFPRVLNWIVHYSKGTGKT